MPIKCNLQRYTAAHLLRSRPDRAVALVCLPEVGGLYKLKSAGP